MRRVEQLMGEDHATVSWSDSAEVALGRMRALACEELVVIDPFGVVGLCERERLIAQQRRGAWLGSIATADLMRRGPFWCRGDDAPERAIRAMERLRTGTLAVLDRHLTVPSFERVGLGGVSRWGLQDRAPLTPDGYEAVFGPQHAQVAAALGNLGELYQVSGRYEEAEPLLRRALAQREQALGADHVFLVPYLTRLARLLLEQGRYHEAQELQRRVLALREQALGPDHPGLVATLDELIDTQRRGGDLAQTEQWIERTLRIRKKFLGEDHPEHGHRLVGAGCSSRGRLSGVCCVRRNVLARCHVGEKGF